MSTSQNIHLQMHPSSCVMGSLRHSVISTFWLKAYKDFQPNAVPG